MPSAKVRIGNWQEELAYEADRKALVRDARASGATLSQRILAKVQRHNEPSQLQVTPDGFLRFNAPLAIQNADTQGCLAADTDDKQQVGTETRFACTTARIAEPKLRSTWVFVPIPSDQDMLLAPDADPSVVHYGQRFQIRSMPDLSETPLFLTSGQKNHLNLSRVSSHQDAYFSQRDGQAAIWTAMYANPEFRLDMEGKPIKANALVILRHQLTNVPLASSSAAKLTNDFGVEFEVCCHRYLTTHSKSGTGAEQPSNLWALVTAPSDE
jgi:hypothetical protein